MSLGHLPILCLLKLSLGVALQVDVNAHRCDAAQWWIAGVSGSDRELDDVAQWLRQATGVDKQNASALAHTETGHWENQTIVDYGVNVAVRISGVDCQNFNVVVEEFVCEKKIY